MRRAKLIESSWTIQPRCKHKGFSWQFSNNSYVPYQEVEQYLKDAGFDVLVFIPSIEEDESRITCGNAILSDGGATCSTYGGDFEDLLL